ncbi:hypothetical protein OEZ85_006936 [Tetradesmus obliquus]|uniref:RING-type domain-containing protein n=1 Tax=Tetradesmus obliquus TaxID=3088 RepID=A0ABY8TWW0_TETOB|nr:hypothetical protein OEZ85_006936 [Tetradesmus obliquus]
MSEESDRSHGQQWWLPQPKPSRDEEHAEWRPAPPLLEALQCRLCGDLLKEPITAAECSHSFCYDCVDKCITIGGRANFCPVCNLLLGPNPYEHNKLKYDFTLDSLVRKVFPRPLLDAALEARRLEREEATRQAKVNINKRPGRPGSFRPVPGQQGSGAGASRAAGTAAGAAAAAAGGEQLVELALFPLPPAAGSSQATAAEALPALPKPYIRAPGSLTVGAMRSWLTDRLAGKKADSVRPLLQLTCAGKEVEDAGMTLQQLHDAVWAPHCAAGVGGSGAAGSVAAQEQPPAAAAAAAGAGQGRSAAAGQQASGDRVMLLYYSL